MTVNPEILEALTTGIQSEVAAYVFYTEALKKVDRDDFKTTLETLAGEEKKHFHVLERQYDSLVRSEKWISTADILKQNGLPDIGEDMAEKHKDLAIKVNALDSLGQLLDMALQLEKDARDLFWKLAEDAKTVEGRKIFGHLAGFEEGHVRLVNDMIEKLED
jgi:rubrerythrin